MHPPCCHPRLLDCQRSYHTLEDGATSVTQTVNECYGFRQLAFSSACFYPTDGSPKKRQNLVPACLLEQNFGENINWINLELFTIHVVAYLCGELMLQLAEADQHSYHDGWMLEWLSGGLELPYAYRQIVGNSIKYSRPLRQRHPGQPFAQDLRIQFVGHRDLSKVTPRSC